MIAVTAQATIRPEARDEALRQAAIVAAASQNESGCLSYRICADVEDPNAFFAFEEWESDDALNAHFAQEHTKAFLAYLAGVLNGEIVTRRYTIESVESL
jgi:quinol monooxygenase YgiN